MRLHGTDERQPVAVSLGELAAMMFSDGEFDRAIELMEKVRGILLRICGPDHHQVAETEFLLGKMLVFAGRMEQSGPLFVHSIRVLQRANSNHWALLELADMFGGRLPDVGY